jgi:hypothetical protein
MPRRDWNAKLDREFERPYERLVPAGDARLGPRRPVRSLPEVRPRRPRSMEAAARPEQIALLPRAASRSGSEPQRQLRPR